MKALLGQSSLVVNALNLMASAGATALFGFIFWMIVTRTFQTEAVGLATTLLSVSGLLSLLGLSGFDTVLVRYLPQSSKRNEHINSGFILSGAASAVIATTFCFIVPFISPSISFIDRSIPYAAIFVVATVLATWNTLTNAVFVAYRRASIVVVINIIFSIVKMVLPLVIHSGGVMTIFIFASIAQFVNVTLSIATLVKYFGYRPSIRLDFAVLNEIKKYGSASYVSSILNLLPDSMLPLIVVNVLGAASAAYFYISFTIANLLYTIAFATNQVLLAEAAHGDLRVSHHIRRGLALTAALIVPAAGIIAVFCPLVLAIFGHNYQGGATGLLRILSLSGLVVMIYSLLNFIFKLMKYLKAMLAMTSANAVAIIGLSFPLAKTYGLLGIGWAWLIGTFAAVTVGGMFVWLRRDEL